MRLRGRLCLPLLLAALAACADDGTPPEPVVARVEIAPESLTQVVGREATFSARALDSSGKLLNGVGLTWGVTDTLRLALLAPGRVRLLAPGEAAVWVRADSAADTAAVRAAAEGEIRWRVRLDWFSTVGGPAMSPDGRTLYVLTLVDDLRQSRLWAVRAADGAVEWSLLIDGAVATYPLVGADGTVYVVGKKLFAVAPEGAFRWVLPIPTAATAGLGGGAISDAGVLYAATGDELLAIDVVTRDTLWRAFTELGQWIVPPTLDPQAGVLYASWAEGPLHALDAATGEILWAVPDTYTILRPGFDARHFMYGPVPASGRVHWPIRFYLETVSPTGEVLWLSDDRSCCAAEPLLAPDGTLLWQHGSGFEPRDPATGLPLWRDPFRDTFIGWGASGALAADGTVYLLAGCGSCLIREAGLYAMDATRQEVVLWSYITNPEQPPDFPSIWNPGMWGAPLIGPDGTVYTYNADTLFAFWDNAPPADTPWPMWRGGPRRSGIVRR